jgi:hypothetical protein
MKDFYPSKTVEECKQQWKYKWERMLQEVINSGLMRYLTLCVRSFYAVEKTTFMMAVVDLYNPRNTCNTRKSCI